MATLTLRGSGAVAGETSQLFPAFGSVGISGYDQPYAVPQLGSRAYDQVGNEYVFVDFGSSQPATGYHYGEFVAFDHNFLCSRLTATSIGSIGVVMAGSAAVTITTTLRYGWIQVYGIHTAAWASTDVTTAITSLPLTAPTTTDLGAVGARGVTTTLGVSVIFGVVARTNPDSCASTALSTSALAAPCTVQLNYPFIIGAMNVHGTS